MIEPDDDTPHQKIAKEYLARFEKYCPEHGSDTSITGERKYCGECGSKLEVRQVPVPEPTDQNDEPFDLTAQASSSAGVFVLIDYCFVHGTLLIRVSCTVPLL